MLVSVTRRVGKSHPTPQQGSTHVSARATPRVGKPLPTCQQALALALASLCPQGGEG